jgi:hypothetical protein
MRIGVFGLSLLLAAAAAAAPGTGGRFSERLEKARKQSGAPKVTVHTVVPSAGVGASPHGDTPAPKTAAVHHRPRRRYHAATPPKPPTPPKTWQFKTVNVLSVDIKVATRGPEVQGDPKTGDVHLTAEPEDTEVFYYLKGGSRLPGANTIDLTNQKPPAGGKPFYILAVAPKLGGRANVFVPVKPGQVTQVHFIFQTKGAAKVKEDRPVHTQITTPDP